MERLLRPVFREQEPENSDIPWYPWDDAVVVDEERGSELEENELREVGEGEREAGQGDGALDAQREETGSPRGGGQLPNVIVLEREDVIVHVPASATTATSTVTQAVTTVAASTSGTATAVTSLTSTRTTPGLLRPLFGCAAAPAPSVRSRFPRACGGS